MRNGSVIVSDGWQRQGQVSGDPDLGPRENRGSHAEDNLRNSEEEERRKQLEEGRKGRDWSMFNAGRMWPVRSWVGDGRCRERGASPRMEIPKNGEAGAPGHSGGEHGSPLEGRHVFCCCCEGRKGWEGGSRGT